MEKSIQNTVKAPLYCNSIVYFLIVAFVVTVDFLTYKEIMDANFQNIGCLLYTSPSPRDCS